MLCRWFEDYERVRSAVFQALSEEGYAVDSADNGRDGLWHAKSGEYDVIVPTFCCLMSARIEILQTLPTGNDHVPCAFAYCLGRVDHRIKGLGRGADDYLVKPFAIAELMARVRALVRRRFGDATNHH